MLGELAFESRDCSRALDHFSKLTSGSRRPLARWQNGVCLFEGERWREAAAEFQALLGIREHPPTRFNLALSHWHAKNLTAALNALAPLSAPDADALSLKALVLRERNEIPEALEVLQGAVAAYPGDERLLLDLALLCLDQNAVDLGAAVLEAGLSRLPRSVRLLTALGVFQVRSGDMKRAEEYFLAAEQLAPQDGLGQVAAATAMIQLGLPDEAIRRLQTIIKPIPIVSLTLARALLQKGGPPSIGQRPSACWLRSSPASPVTPWRIASSERSSRRMEKSVVPLRFWKLPFAWIPPTEPQLISCCCSTVASAKPRRQLS